MWRGIGYNIRNQNRRKKSNLLFHPFLQDFNTLLTFPQEGTGVCAPEGAVQRGTYPGALSLHSLRPANAGSCSKPNCKCLYFHGHDVCIQWCRLKYCYCSCLIKQALLLKLHSHDGTFPAIHNEYPPPPPFQHPSTYTSFSIMYYNLWHQSINFAARWESPADHARRCDDDRQERPGAHLGQILPGSWFCSAAVRHTHHQRDSPL